MCYALAAAVALAMEGAMAAVGIFIHHQRVKRGALLDLSIGTGGRRPRMRRCSGELPGPVYLFGACTGQTEDYGQRRIGVWRIPPDIAADGWLALLTDIACLP